MLICLIITLNLLNTTNSQLYHFFCKVIYLFFVPVYSLIQLELFFFKMFIYQIFRFYLPLDYQVRLSLFPRYPSIFGLFNYYL